MTDYNEEEERAARIVAVKEDIANRINADPSLGSAYPWELEEDILYDGPLAALLEFFQENRSELEELGN